MRGEEKGTAPVIKQVSWFQVHVLIFFFKILNLIFLLYFY